jgi:hypothetical protein
MSTQSHMHQQLSGNHKEISFNILTDKLSKEMEIFCKISDRNPPEGKNTVYTHM